MHTKKTGAFVPIAGLQAQKSMVDDEDCNGIDAQDAAKHSKHGASKVVSEGNFSRSMYGNAKRFKILLQRMEKAGAGFVHSSMRQSCLLQRLYPPLLPSLLI